MPFTTPPNFAAGAILTEAQLDILSDNETFLANPPTASVFNSAAVSIPNATETLMTWDSENFDTDTMHSTSTNTSRITATTAGKYQVSAFVAIAANATGNIRYLVLKRNGNNLLLVESNSPIAARDTNLALSWLVSMTAGQYLEVAVYQNSGGALNAQAGSGFAAAWVSL